MKLTNALITRYFSSHSNKEDLKLSKVQENNAKKAVKYVEIAEDAKLIRSRISDLDLDHLVRISNDCAAHPAIKALIEAIIYMGPKVLGEKYNDKYIKACISNLHETNFGYTASLFKAEHLLTLKNLNGSAEMRAFVIADFGLNQLRDSCPNFRYYYTLLNISEIVSNDGKVVSWLPEIHGGKYTLMLWENVENHPHAQSLSNFIASASAEEFLKAYVQVLYALRAADNHCEFTHYNLTADKVYLVDTKETSIKYSTENNRHEFLTTAKFAKIIDYRMAHANVEINGSYYHFGTFAQGVYQDHGWIIQDAYTLLMSCMHLAKDYGNEQVVQLGRRFLEFFNTEDSLEDVLHVQKKYSYHLPYTKETKRWSLDMYLRYIRSNFHCRFMSSQAEAPIYGERKYTHLEYLGLTKEPKPEELLDFFDMYAGSKNPEKVKLSFDYFTGMRDHMSMTRSIFDRSADIFSTIDVIPVGQEEFLNGVYELFNAFDYYLTGRFYSHTAAEVSTIFEDPVTRTKITTEAEEFRASQINLITRWTNELYRRMGNTYLYQFWTVLLRY